MKPFYGNGYNDRSRPTSLNNKKLKEYTLWHSMLTRCFCKKYQSRQPTYEKCFISENFKNYSYFYDWCQNQIGFDQDGWQLDKDILVKGNTIYSEDTCVFVPKDLNVLLEKSNAARGSNPIGVSFCKDRGLFQVAIKKGGKRIGLGRYNCPKYAFTVYKKAKEDHIKFIAEKWKDYIDHRAYAALMQYTVEITD